VDLYSRSDRFVIDSDSRVIFHRMCRPNLVICLVSVGREGGFYERAAQAIFIKFSTNALGIRLEFFEVFRLTILSGDGVSYTKPSH
jgi:hypothetical protein